MLVAGGDLLQREAVKRLGWFEFYETMRRLKERNDRERDTAQQQVNRIRAKSHGKD